MAARRILVPLSVALLAALSSAGASGLLASDAAAQVARRPEDEDDSDTPLVLALPQTHATGMMLAHRSHSSHQSHSSHRSHYSGSGGGGGYVPDPSPEPAPAPPPPPPKPATVSFVAFPGGRISIDGVVAGNDATGALTLKAGTHAIRIENRFLGDHTTMVALTEGQTGIVTIEW